MAKIASYSDDMGALGAAPLALAAKSSDCDELEMLARWGNAAVKQHIAGDGLNEGWLRNMADADLQGDTLLADLRSGTATVTYQSWRGLVDRADDDDRDPTCYVDAIVTVAGPGYAAKVNIWSHQADWSGYNESGNVDYSRDEDAETIYYRGADSCSVDQRSFSVYDGEMSTQDTNDLHRMLLAEIETCLEDLRREAKEYAASVEAEDED